MEQQLQKLTQAILVRGDLLKQLEVQCAAIQASVEEMKPKPVTPPAQASSLRSLATGELDNLMPARCSKMCSGDDTASQKSALMSDAAPGSPATAALLDVAITSLTPFIGASRECADTCIITAHQLFGEMPPCADVDHAIVEATPGTDPAPPLNVVPDANVHLALVTQLATSTPSGVTANFTDCGNELNRGCPLCLHGMRKLFDEIPVRSSGVLWLPPVKCVGWCPWPPPCQVQSISHEAEARRMSWPSLGGDREGGQLKQLWPPPIQFLSGVFAEMVFLTGKRVAPILKLVELKPWPLPGHLKCSVTCSVVGAQGSSTALLWSGNSVGPIASNIGPNSRRVLTCGMRLWQQKRGVLDFACKEVLMLYKQELPTMDYAADIGRKSGFLDKCITNRKYKTLILRSSYVAGHEEVIAAVSYQIVPVDTQYAEISLTVVRSSYQRVGIGQLLYKELSQSLQNVGVTTIFCWADKVSERFWLKQGFVSVGEVDAKGKIHRIPVRADIRRALCFPGGSTLMVTHLKKALLALQEISLENLQTSQLHDVAPDSISPGDTHTAIPSGENFVLRTFGCHKVSKTGSGGHSLSGQQPKKRTYEASSSSLKSKRIRYSCHADHYQDMNRNDICDETLSKRLIKLSQSNKVRSATELFDSMGASGLLPSAHACNSLLASFVRRSSLADAMKMFEYMKGKGMATGHTYTLILKAVASTEGYIVALEMFNKIEEENESRKFLNVIVYNTMISVCGRAKDWTQAERLWRRLGENSLSGTLMTYDLLVSTFVHCGQSELAIAAYQEILQNGLEPSEDIMKAIIASCTKEGKWEFALATFRRMLSAGMKPNIIVFNSIINSLGKAGEDELACFVPGMLALGASGYGSEKVDEIMNLAKELAWTYYNFYQSIPTKLAGENYYFHAEQDMIVGTSWNMLRPETVESLMYLWRLTENKTYQDWGWEIFQALEKNSRIESRYVGLKDVNTSTKDDVMSSFFLAETLKYLYLLFSPPSVISFDEWVFNTEAHPLRIVTRHNSEGCSGAAKGFFLPSDLDLHDERIQA